MKYFSSYRSYLSLLLSLLFTGCGYKNESKQVENTVTSTIINGTPATNGINSANSVILKRLDNSSLGCSGVVITNDFVLTAAHCVYDLSTHSLLDSSDLAIIYGPNSIYFDSVSPTHQVISAEEIIVNPDFDIYKPLYPQPDVALIKLKYNLRINGLEKGYRQNVCSSSVGIGQKVTSYGYGFARQMTETERSSYAKGPRDLNSAEFFVSSLAGYGFLIPTNPLNQRIYHGDSGGGSFLVGTNCLIGIHSSGNSTDPTVPSYEVGSWHFYSWLWGWINWYFEQESTPLIVLDRTNNLVNQTIAIVSLPFGASTPSGFLKTSKDWKFTNIDATLIDTYRTPEGLWRNKYKLTSQSLELNIDKCDPYILGAHVCKIRSFVYSDSGRYLSFDNNVVVK